MPRVNWSCKPLRGHLLTRSYTWLICFACGYVLSTQAMGKGRPELLPHIKQNASFVVIEKFKNTQRPASVVYGNPHYGFFETEDFRFSGGELKVRLVPPGYRLPVKFFVKTEQGPRIKYWPIGERRYQSPLLPAYHGITLTIKGMLSQNFYVLSGSLPISSLANYQKTPLKPDLPLKNKSRFSFVFIVNKIGEIVWVYFPFRENEHFDSYIFAKPLGEGQFGLIMGKKDGYFAVVDYLGRSLINLNTRDRKDPFPIHHDFILSKDNLISISNSVVHYNNDAYLTNLFVQVDFKTNRRRDLADMLEVFHPETVSHWVENKEKPRFVSWGDETADHDFLHANALTHQPGKGYLVSLKHLDKLVFYDESWKKIRWTLGQTNRDTFYAEGEARFSHQHAPQLLADDRILMFDNGFHVKKSRALELKLNSEKRSAEVVWQYRPTPALFSENRSSVSKLADDKVLVFFVDPEIYGDKSKHDWREDVLQEVSYPEGKLLGEMRLRFQSASPGYRAMPVAGIGLEQALPREKWPQ